LVTVPDEAGKAVRICSSTSQAHGLGRIQEISKTNNPQKKVRALAAPDGRGSPENWGALVAVKIIKLGNIDVRGKQ
jgi:hypothetical protein